MSALFAPFKWLAGLPVWLSTHVDSQVLAGLCLTAVLVVSVLSVIYVERWPDQLTLIGFTVTVAGFGYTIYELFRSRQIAQVATAEYQKAARQQSTEHYRFCLERARTLIEEALAQAQGKRWQSVSVRTKDLMFYLNHIQAIRPHANDRWLQFANTLQVWLARLDSGTTGKALNINLDEWHTTLWLIHNNVTGELGPLAFYQEG